MPPPGALNRRTQSLLIAGVALLLCFSVYRLYFASPPGPYVAFSGNTMGTTWNVKVAGDGLGPDAMRLIGAGIDTALDDVVGRMSTWEKDSELSRFNATESTGPFSVSPPVLELLGVAQRVSLLSEGAFDVTVGPLVDAWGFGSRDPAPSPPSQATLQRLLGRVGYRGLDLNPTTGHLAKSHPGMRVDVSAIAKGYGVDRVGEALERLGHRDYLVEVGGELLARGRRNDGRAWRVAIERPSEEVGTLHRVLELHDRAMATSGDYRNYYEANGQRVSHTIDPRTGRPIRHGLASVSVIHESATWADAWATALNVLGPEAGYALAEAQGLAVHFIVRDGPEGFENRSTPAFEALVETAQPDPGTRSESPSSTLE
ncbi:MAG TPA: FAD:protein FMN transferase [Myxococcales bacterium]|nr:FAD:protein FMN transferase [Myxococcales bacterium]